MTTGGTASELTTWRGWLGTRELEGYKHLFSSSVTRHVNSLSRLKISSSLSLLGTTALCWTCMLVGSCSAMRACLRRDSKSAPSSKWWRRALRILSEYVPVQYRVLNMLRAAAALPVSFILLTMSSSLQPQADMDSVGNCRAVKNFSNVMSVGQTSPNRTSNLSRTCWTLTSVPIAKRASAALPLRDLRTLVMIMGSWYSPALNMLWTSLLHWAYEGSFFRPSPEKAASFGGMGAATDGG